MKVAVLDDDKTVLETVSQLLNGAGFTCAGFDNGRQLVRALHRDTFDLFIIDWNLPDLPGINVLEWIRNQIGAQPPVLLLTNRVSDEDMVAGLRAGADDFVTKPIDYDLLQAKMAAFERKRTNMIDRLRLDHIAVSMAESMLIGAAFVAVLGVLGVLCLMTLYELKSSIGIDIFKDAHLSDVLRR